MVGRVADAVDRVSMRHPLNGPEIPRSGWDAWQNRLLPDGRLLALEPLVVVGMARLHVAFNPNAWASTDIFDYQDPLAAVEAFQTWDGVDEPVGWYRHRPSNRRRTNGDPSKEYVEP